jgi:hypothetical protein
MVLFMKRLFTAASSLLLTLTFAGCNNTPTLTPDELQTKAAVQSDPLFQDPFFQETSPTNTPTVGGGKAYDLQITYPDGQVATGRWNIKNVNVISEALLTFQSESFYGSLELSNGKKYTLQGSHGYLHGSPVIVTFDSPGDIKFAQLAVDDSNGNMAGTASDGLKVLMRGVTSRSLYGDIKFSSSNGKLNGTFHTKREGVYGYPVANGRILLLELFGDFCFNDGTVTTARAYSYGISGKFTKDVTIFVGGDKYGEKSISYLAVFKGIAGFQGKGKSVSRENPTGTDVTISNRR